jgi:hypothetical protein
MFGEPVSESLKGSKIGTPTEEQVLFVPIYSRDG